MPDRIARVWNGTSWEVITSTAAAANAVVVYQSASPSGPVTGQVWVDSDDRQFYIWNGSSWISAITTFNYQSASPSGPVTGQIWVDSTTDVMSVWNGTSWIPTKINASSISSGTLAVARGGTGITSFGTGIATWLGTPSSANLAAAVTDETGTGALVFANSPTFTGVPTAPTASSGTSTTQIATTQFVANNFEKSIPLQVSAPSSPATSDLWVDSSGATPILRVYNGTSWVALASPADDDQNILAGRIFI